MSSEKHINRLINLRADCPRQNRKEFISGTLLGSTSAMLAVVSEAKLDVLPTLLKRNNPNPSSTPIHYDSVALAGIDGTCGVATAAATILVFKADTTRGQFIRSICGGVAGAVVGPSVIAVNAALADQTIE